MNPATRATAATATPQHFVPFDVTREHAEQLVREYVKGAEYLPKGFDPSFNQLRAMYVPFYVYDVFVYGETGFVSYKVVQVSRGINTHLHYALRIKGHGEFSGVFVDATGRMPDGLAQSVAPFDFNEPKHSGEDRAEDIPIATPKVMPVYAAKKARLIAVASFRQAARDEMVRRTHGFFNEGASTDRKNAYKTFDRGTESAVLESTLVALPMWVLDYTWEGQDYRLMVNGQTGACGGNLPVDSDAQENAESWGQTRRLLAMLAGLSALTILFVGIGLPSFAVLSYFVFGSVYVWRQNKTYREDRAAAMDAAVRSAQKAADSSLAQLGQEVRFDLHRSKHAKDEDEAVALAKAPRTRDLRQTAMWDFACEASNEFCKRARARMRGLSVLRRRGLPYDTFVPFEEDLLLIHDGALSADASRGYAISNAGLWCYPEEGKGDFTFTSWEVLADIPDADLDFLADAEENVILHEELLRLYMRLRGKAQQVYG